MLTGYQNPTEIPVAAAIRRRWLLAVWAAEKMGLYGTMADLYARNVKAVSDPDMNDEALVVAIEADLASLDKNVGRKEIRSELNRIGDVIQQKIL